MSNEYYNSSGAPVTSSAGASAVIRSEYAAIAAGFALLPTLGGNANMAVVVNGSGTALTTTAFPTSTISTTGAFTTVFAQVANVTLTLPGTNQTLATLAGAETLTNKTVTSATLNGSTILAGSLSASGHTVTGGTFSSISIAGATLSGTLTATGQTIIGGTFSGPTLSGVTLGGTTTFGGPVTATGQTVTGGTFAGPTLSGTVTGGTFASGTWNGNTIGVAFGGTGLTSGTSGGVLAFTASGTIASSGALTANKPVIGGGAGAAPTVGATSGNTTTFATTSGSLTSAHLAAFDASGNIVDGGAAPSAPVFTTTATSSETAIPASAAAITPFAHGLAVVPPLLCIVLRCKTSEGGFVAGEEAPISAFFDGLAEPYFGISADSTNVYIGSSSHDAAPSVKKRTDGSVFTLTDANWKIVIRATK